MEPDSALLTDAFSTLGYACGAAISSPHWSYRTEQASRNSGFRIGTQGMDFVRLSLTWKCRPSQCPWTASASFFRGVGRLIKREK